MSGEKSTQERKEGGNKTKFLSNRLETRYTNPMENKQEKINEIINKVLQFFPDILGIYLFGSFQTEYETPESDVDIAILLPLNNKVDSHSREFRDLLFALMDELDREVDLINLRQVDTVFQHEIIQSGRLLYRSNPYAVEEYEMLTMSYYQKLNEERKEILQEIVDSGMVLTR
jgi:predicted nucleotidyltransferase